MGDPSTSQLYFSKTGLGVFTNSPSKSLDVSGTANFSGIATSLTAASGTNTTQIATTAFVTTAISGVVGNPVGTILMTMTATVPTNYLYCNGQSFSTSSPYNTLFSDISYNFGGSGINFNVPDLRGAFLRGLGTNDANPSYTGNSIGTAQVDSFKLHDHSISDPGHNHISTGYRINSQGLTPAIYNWDVTTADSNSQNWLSSNSNTTGITVGSTGSNETKPFNYSVYYYIKYQ